MRMPNEDEMREVAQDLGIVLDPDQPIPANQRSRLAKVAFTMQQYDAKTKRPARDKDAPLFRTEHDTPAGTLVIECYLIPKETTPNG